MKRLTGNDVRRIREALKETQAQFAKRLMYAGQVHVSRIEARGDQVISRGADARIKNSVDAHLRSEKGKRK